MAAGWTPGIGDPTAVGWFTVIAYFAAALLCMIAGHRDVGSRVLWWGLGALMLLLGINKQLDLQSLLTQIGRDIAISEHWYERRRAVQKGFVIVLAAVSLVGCAILIWTARQRSLAVRAALVGLALLLGFVGIRATSFEHVDFFLGSRMLGARFNAILELGGIGIIAAAAVAALRENQDAESIDSERPDANA